MPVARAAGKRFALTFYSQAEKDAPIKAETGAPDVLTSSFSLNS